MRIDILMAAQGDFLARYPLGFDDEEIVAIKKKHNTHKLHVFVVDAFAKDKFGFEDVILEDMIRVIQRATMVSMFEKPKFRDYVRSLTPVNKELLVHGLYELLHGDQEKGFNQIIAILADGKMARWSLISAFLYYSSPEVEVFCKPTTVKNIIRTFELEDLIYKPRPSYDFYVKFRKSIIEMKSFCDPRIGTDNAGMTGFLMMTMPSADH